MCVVSRLGVIVLAMAFKFRSALVVSRWFVSHTLRPTTIYKTIRLVTFVLSGFVMVDAKRWKGNAENSSLVFNGLSS